MTITNQLLRVARDIAKRYQRTSVHAEWDDILSDAMFGLVVADQKMTGEPNFRYVAKTVTGHILDGFRRRGVIAHHGTWHRPPLHLDQPGADGQTLAGTLLAPAGWEEHADGAADAALILRRLNSRRDRYIVAQVDIEDRRLASVGAELGISEGRVSQLRTAALRHLATATEDTAA